MGTHDAVWAHAARPILSERDYRAVQGLLTEAAPEQPRTLALMREVADYEGRGVALSAAVAWAEWVVVPRFDSEDQPHRRWSDTRLGFLGQFALR
jgi:hypothetical protein